LRAFFIRNWIFIIKMKKDLRIIFLGTPDFAVENLKALVEDGQNIVAVITAPDKPAGRGRKIQETAVKKYAKEQNLFLMQPSNLKDESFLQELKSLEADLQIVVAFRMLPVKVWDMPTLGTFNLHASLLPQYRGAAPINWAIMNGEKETGVSTFFLQHKIDTGNIIFQEKVIISENMDVGDLHDKLMHLGANLVVKTVHSIIEEKIEETVQKDFPEEDLKSAPKIFKEDCLINWKNPLQKIHNHIRGLSPYPTAWTKLDNKKLKIFKALRIEEEHDSQTGLIVSDKKTYLKIAVESGFIQIEELQLEGKKRITIKDFLRGFQNTKLPEFIG